MTTPSVPNGGERIGVPSACVKNVRLSVGITTCAFLSLLVSLSSANADILIGVPPRHYSRSFGGRVVVQRVPLEAIRSYCHFEPSPGAQLGGCAYISKSVCHVIEPQLGPGMGRALQRAIHGHELAHCSGWSHRGARIIRIRER